MKGLSLGVLWSHLCVAFFFFFIHTHTPPHFSLLGPDQWALPQIRVARGVVHSPDPWPRSPGSLCGRSSSK